MGSPGLWGTPGPSDMGGDNWVGIRGLGSFVVRATLPLPGKTASPQLQETPCWPRSPDTSHPPVLEPDTSRCHIPAGRGQVSPCSPRCRRKPVSASCFSQTAPMGTSHLPRCPLCLPPKQPWALKGSEQKLDDRSQGGRCPCSPRAPGERPFWEPLGTPSEGGSHPQPVFPGDQQTWLLSQQLPIHTGHEGTQQFAVHSSPPVPLHGDHHAPILTRRVECSWTHPKRSTGTLTQQAFSSDPPWRPPTANRLHMAECPCSHQQGGRDESWRKRKPEVLPSPICTGWAIPSETSVTM